MRPSVTNSEEQYPGLDSGDLNGLFEEKKPGMWGRAKSAMGSVGRSIAGLASSGMRKARSAIGGVGEWFSRQGSPKFEPKLDEKAKHGLSDEVIRGITQDGKTKPGQEMIEKAMAAPARSPGAIAGQQISEASKKVSEQANSGLAKTVSNGVRVATGIDVAGGIKHVADLADVAGTTALHGDTDRQAIAHMAQWRDEQASDKLAAANSRYQQAREVHKAVEGNSRLSFTDEGHEAELANHRLSFTEEGSKAELQKLKKARNRAVMMKVHKNLKLNAAHQAIGIAPIPEMTQDQTEAIDHNLENTKAALPKATMVGRAAQGLRATGQGLAQAGHVWNGSGHEQFMENHQYGRAAASAAKGIANVGTEAAGVGFGVHGTLTEGVIKTAGYGARGLGTLMDKGGHALAKAQDQRDRQHDFTTGARQKAVRGRAIDWQGAQSRHKPTMKQKAFDAMGKALDTREERPEIVAGT